MNSQQVTRITEDTKLFQVYYFSGFKNTVFLNVKDPNTAA